MLIPDSDELPPSNLMPNSVDGPPPLPSASDQIDQLPPPPPALPDQPPPLPTGPGRRPEKQQASQKSKLPILGAVGIVMIATIAVLIRHSRTQDPLALEVDHRAHYIEVMRNWDKVLTHNMTAAEYTQPVPSIQWTEAPENEIEAKLRIDLGTLNNFKVPDEPPDAHDKAFKRKLELVEKLWDVIRNEFILVEFDRRIEIHGSRTMALREATEGLANFRAAEQQWIDKTSRPKAESGRPAQHNRASPNRSDSVGESKSEVAQDQMPRASSTKSPTTPVDPKSGRTAPPINGGYFTGTPRSNADPAASGSSGGGASGSSSGGATK
jgi:hypothetical protein